MKVSHLFTFLTGALLGVIIALLLAPESGAETREKINAKLKEKGINLSKDQLDEFIDELKKKLHLDKYADHAKSEDSEAEDVTNENK